MRVNPNYTGDILSAIWAAQDRAQTAVEQLASGKRVNRPSDDPAASAGEIQNQARSDINDQFLQNVNTVQSMLQTADSTLSSVVTGLTNAISYGVQGANGTVSDVNRQQLAQSVQGILSQVVQLANTEFHGVYIFGGTAVTAPPFVADVTGIRYIGNLQTNSVEVLSGASTQVNVPGSQLFQQPGADVLGSLQGLVTALQSGSSTDVGNATTQLRSAFDYLTQQRTFYGSGMNRLADDQTYLNQEKVNIASEQNNLVGADLAKVMTDLTSATTAHDAALAAAAKVLPTSLLDYLK